MQAVTEQVQPLRSSLPRPCNFSRFLKQLSKLEADTGLVSEMIVTLRHQLMAEVPDFGRCLGYDGKALRSHSTGRTLAGKDRTSDPDADWGKHKTSGRRQDGTLWEKIKSWFGYRVHLIADTHYEIPAAVQLREASRSEIACLRDSMLPQLFEQTPELAERCQQFTADRGLECSQLKASLYDEYEIRPLIDHKMMWRQEKQDQNYDPKMPITRLLHDGVRTDNIVYDVCVLRPKNSGRWRSVDSK